MKYIQELLAFIPYSKNETQEIYVHLPTCLNNNTRIKRIEETTPMPPVLRIYGFGGVFFFFFRGEGGRKERDVKTAKMDCRKKN